MLKKSTETFKWKGNKSSSQIHKVQSEQKKNVTKLQETQPSLCLIGSRFEKISSCLSLLLHP